jgi:hypothetical protein
MGRFCVLFGTSVGWVLRGTNERPTYFRHHSPKGRPGSARRAGARGRALGQVRCAPPNWRRLRSTAGRLKEVSSELRQPTAAEETEADRAGVAADGQVLVPGTGKNPAHWANATRNLVDTRTGTLVKIHLYLLTHVAGRKVYI